MKMLIYTAILSLIINHADGQNIQYEYDRANRLIQIIYPNNKVTNYNYDKDGNRISKSITLIDTSVTPLSIIPTDSANLTENLWVYPNPSTGAFFGKIYSSKKQEIAIKIFTVDGQQVYSYLAKNIFGYHNFNINITPLTSGTYILSIQGAYIKEQRKIVLIK